MLPSKPYNPSSYTQKHLSLTSASKFCDLLRAGVAEIKKGIMSSLSKNRFS